NLPGEVQGENAPRFIIDRNVALHAKPDARSRLVARVSYVLVQAFPDESPDPVTPVVRWNSVEYPLNSTSYVMATKMRDPEGFHVCFAKEPVGWRIRLRRAQSGL